MAQAIEEFNHEAIVRLAFCSKSWSRFPDRERIIRQKDRLVGSHLLQILNAAFGVGNDKSFIELDPSIRKLSLVGIASALTPNSFIHDGSWKLPDDFALHERIGHPDLFAGTV